MSPDKLVYMANQIGKFFAHQPEEKAVAGIADHLRKFWDPRMRKAILEHLADGGRGFDPLTRKAVVSLGEGAERRPA
jgi:formate dehydrogenase subunit delta